MKKCRRCANQATLHITEIIEGVATEVHLCENCARDYLDEPDSGDPDSVAAELAAKLEQIQAGDNEHDLVCDDCGTTFADFREVGRLGCPSCYQSFENELRPLLENIHEELMHIGKRPKRARVSSDEHSRVLSLRNQQREAIRAEDYEKAAKLRDQIAELEAQLHGPGVADPN